MAYIVATIVLLATVFGCIFGYKQFKIYNYRNILTVMEEKQPEEIENLIEQDESFIFLLTSEDCPYCIEFLPSVKNSIQQHDTLPIYYTCREKDVDSLIKSLLVAKKIPFMARIENGIMVQNYFDNPINFFN